MMNCPNCGFNLDTNSAIQDSLSAAVTSRDSSEAPDTTVALALRGAIYSEIGKHLTDGVEVCAKLSSSTFKALIVADENAYADYNKIVAEIPQEFAYWTLEGLVLADEEQRADIEQLRLRQAAEAMEAGVWPCCGYPWDGEDRCFCDFRDSSKDYKYPESQKLQDAEKAKFRVTQAATEVSAEFAAYEELEQYSRAIAVAVEIGFAASDVLMQRSLEDYTVSEAAFHEFLASTTAAVEEAHAKYEERRIRPPVISRRVRLDPLRDQDDDLPF